MMRWSGSIQSNLNCFPGTPGESIEKVEARLRTGCDCGHSCLRQGHFGDYFRFLSKRSVIFFHMDFYCCSQWKSARTRYSLYSSLSFKQISRGIRIQHEIRMLILRIKTLLNLGLSAFLRFSLSYVDVVADFSPFFSYWIFSKYFGGRVRYF